MKSCSSLIKVTASFLFWGAIGIEAYHDNCNIESLIRCEVPSRGYGSCKTSIVNTPTNCEGNVPVVFKFRVCNRPATGAAVFADFTTTINKSKVQHYDVLGTAIAPKECKWMAVASTINSCKPTPNWAMLRTTAQTATGLLCNGFAFWRMVPPPPPPTPAPVPPAAPCDIDVHVSCNRVDKLGWPNCNEMTYSSPGTCGVVPVSMRSRVCNLRSDVVQLTRGVMTINGFKTMMNPRYKTAVYPNTCQFIRERGTFDTCQYDTFWAWFNARGVTLGGQLCEGYDYWEQYIPYMIPPTSPPVPVTDPCVLETDVSCNVVGNRTSWGDCENIVRDPNNCEQVPVSMKFVVCNNEVTDSTSLVDVKAVINGLESVLDLIPVGRELAADECVVQRKRAYFNTCAVDQYYAWINVIGDGGCSDYTLWSHSVV